MIARRTPRPRSPWARPFSAAWLWSRRPRRQLPALRSPGGRSSRERSPTPRRQPTRCAPSGCARSSRHPMARWPALGLPRRRRHLALSVLPRPGRPLALCRALLRRRGGGLGRVHMHRFSVHHALILAAHGWRHEPLQTLSDLIDVAVVSAAADRRELERTADIWGIGRVWRTTISAIDAVFYGASVTLPLRTWARHLQGVRERTVAEDHLERVLHPFWGMPPHRASRAAMRAAAGTIRPAPGETWGNKLTRTRRALRRARTPIVRRTGPQPKRRDPRERPD